MKNGEVEEFDMCLALKELREDGRNEGLLDGFLLASKIVKALQGNVALDNGSLMELCQCSMKEVEAVRSAFEI